jgi:hypothetical protein
MVNQSFDIISPASGATLNNHTYLGVYCGSGGGSAIVNGTHINFHEGSSVKLLVRSISDVVGNLHLLGFKRYVMDGSSRLGGNGGGGVMRLPNPIVGTFIIESGEIYAVSGVLVIDGELIIRNGGQLTVTGTITNNGVIVNEGSLIII